MKNNILFILLILQVYFLPVGKRFNSFEPQTF